MNQTPFHGRWKYRYEGPVLYIPERVNHSWSREPPPALLLLTVNSMAFVLRCFPFALNLRYAHAGHNKGHCDMNPHGRIKDTDAMKKEKLMEFEEDPSQNHICGRAGLGRDKTG